MRQLAPADLIVLKKVDRITADEVADLCTWLNAQATRTPVIDAIACRVPIEVLLGQHRGRGAPSDLRGTAPRIDHGHLYRSRAIERAAPISRKSIERRAASQGEGIFRAKGIVHLQGDRQRWHVYQQVGRRCWLEAGERWGARPLRTCIVPIGRHRAIDSKALDEPVAVEQGRRRIDAGF